MTVSMAIAAAIRKNFFIFDSLFFIMHVGVHLAIILMLFEHISNRLCIISNEQLAMSNLKLEIRNENRTTETTGTGKLLSHMPNSSHLSHS